MSDEETPGQVIAKITVSATGRAFDSEGRPLDADGNPISEGEQE